MKTVKYERTDKTNPLIDNPFTVISSELKIILPGKISIIETGIKIQVPENCILSVCRNLRTDLVIVNVFTKDDNLFVTATTYTNDDVLFVRPGDKLALIKILDSIDSDVRFIEFSNGNRKIYGDKNAIS